MNAIRGLSASEPCRFFIAIMNDLSEIILKNSAALSLREIFFTSAKLLAIFFHQVILFKDKK